MGEVKKNNISDFPKDKSDPAANIAQFLALYREFSFGHEGPEWLRERRYSALTALEEHGLPGPALERWKYTNLPAFIGKLAALQFAKSAVSFIDPDGVVQSLHALLGADETPLWLREILCAEPAGAARYGDMLLWELCNAFMRDGLVVDLPANKVVDNPVEITITGADGQFFVPRTVFRLGQGSQLTVIEHHGGQGSFWNNRLTQIRVGAGARLRHYRIQDYDPRAAYTQNTHVQIERDGTYEAFTLTLGAGMSRNQIHAELPGTGAHCLLAGVNLLRGIQHGDTTITIEHQAPHGSSDQFYRTVLDDQARGVFQGKVHVHQAAQKTDGYQLSNTLLLSEGAEMDTKPELEIYADDVKCSHGATTGQIDDAPLFYLRSRGLSEQAARALLVEAFAGEAVDKIGDETVQEQLRQRITAWLNL